jgi:tetratricopeptide (TPR) repeat protein
MQTARSWPRPSELDPIKLGVHRARPIPSRSEPTYQRRDCHSRVCEELEAAAVGGGFVLVVGDSTAGKSRLAYETLIETLPNHVVFIPDTGQELRDAALALPGVEAKVLIWLDDLERYLGPEGLSPGVLSTLQASDCVLLSTMRAESYRQRRLIRRDAYAGDDDRNHATAVERVLNQVEPIILQRRWTAGEIALARSSSDPRIKEAVGHSDVYGIGEYLTAGPALLQEWQLAWEPGTNPRGASLVAAAVDCIKVGLSSVPFELLATLHETYLLASGGSLLRPEPITEALTWATALRFGVTSLLMPQAQTDHYRAFDYLLDSPEFEKGAIPDLVWSGALEVCALDSSTLFRIGFFAAAGGKGEFINQAIASLVALDDIAKAGELAHAAARFTTDRALAESWGRKSVDLGSLDGAVELGLLLEKDGRFEEARMLYLRASEAGHTHGRVHLALLNRNEHALEAEDQLRDLLEWDTEKSDSDTEVKPVVLANGPLAEAAIGLGRLLAETDREDEAELWWRRVAEGPFTSYQGDALFNLGMLFRSQERLAESRDAYVQALTLFGPERVADRTDTETNLGAVLMQLGDVEAATEMFFKAASKKDGMASFNLGVIHHNNGDLGQSENRFREAVSRNYAPALARLGDLVLAKGEKDEAKALYELGAEKGDPRAFMSLADVCLSEEDLDGYEANLKKASEKEDPQADCWYGSFLHRQGETARAIELLRRSLAAGHGHAGCRLGQLLVTQQDATTDDVIEAEAAFWSAMNDGHEHAAQPLKALLLAQGRGRDAARILRSENHIPSMSSNKKKKKKRRNRR